MKKSDMKSFVLTFLLAILGFQMGAYAQPSVTPLVNTIDSLQRLVNAHPKEDTTKVNLLHTLARFCFYDLQYKRGIVNAQGARALAQKINYRKGEGLYLRALAVLNIGTLLSFYYDIQTRWFYERIKEKETVSMLEAPQQSTLDLEKVNTELLIALKYAQQQQDKELKAILLQLISEMYSGLEKYDNCLIHADQAIQIFREINQPIPAFYILTSKIIVLEKLKRLKEVKEMEAQLIKIITQTKDVKDKALLCERLGMMYRYSIQNNSGLALEYLFKANTLLEQLGETQLRVEVLAEMGYAFNALIMNKKAVDYYTKAVPLLDNVKNYPFTVLHVLKYLSYSHIKIKQFREASHYIKQVNDIANKWGIKNDFFNHDAQGEILMYQGHPQEAIAHFHLCNEVYKAENNTQENHPFMNLYIGQCYLALGKLNESIAYGEKAYKRSFTFNRHELLTKASLLLTEAYDKMGQPMKAYEYLKQYRAGVKANEEQDLVGRSSMAEIEGIIQKSEQEKATLEREKLVKEAENQNQRWWLITVAGILMSVFVLVLVLYRNNRQKQRANTLLHQQKEEIDYQRTKAENALTDLKSTQVQLIQKEKLASLGELTAGIAHEIQNPLNFVNNFSELSVELLEELSGERSKQNGERDEVLESELLTDISQNLEKINHHGKRASSIVKGMLEHSKASTGKKELTDINALADEYLRLAYHGLRAKDSGFNADYQLDLDANLPKALVIPQDMGRVLLNLFNNAFYAVARTDNPLVQVSTKKLANSIEIRVKDNGTGIPEHIKSKIFQPFFTTKPTGEGTGLGLSLSYDIITKGHGGTIEVESVGGEGTEFIITLPG